GDRVAQAMTIDNSVIYSVEGRRVQSGSSRPNDRNLPWSSTSRRTRVNWLTAYQTNGGKALWTRSGGEEGPESSPNAGFLSAPVPYRQSLLVPVTEGGTIWLVAMERATGKTIWKTFLCDEPDGGAAP